MNELALCAGNGGMSLGIKLAVPTARTVCYVEREAFAAEDLAKKMGGEEGKPGLAPLDPAPVWSDLTTFDGRPWRGKVDLISGGLPCQPFSAAGKRQHLEDDRWLWDDTLRILDETGATSIFLENVPGLRKRGLPVILRDLDRRGFNVEWDVFSAAQVGAPHLRKRLFVLATNADRRGQQSIGESKPPRVERAQGDQPDGRDRSLPDPESPRSPKREGIHVAAELARPGEGRWWATEPAVGRVVDGAPDRVDRIRSIGNGVVPLVVAYAFRTLASRI